MLIEFRVENHRSVRAEQILTMEAGRGGNDQDSRARGVEGYAERLLSVAAVYGANASGKSNVVSAIGSMRRAVVSSHRAWDPKEGVRRDPFAWGAWRGKPSMFEASFVAAGARYEYGFVANDERFLEEWLYAWPHGHKQVWYERDGDTFTFGDNLKGKNRVVEEVTRPNALFLSTAAQLKHKQLDPVYAWFYGLRTWNLDAPRLGRFEPPIQLWIDRMVRDSDDLHGLRGFLEAADLGIVDLRLEAAPDEVTSIDKWPRRGRRIEVRHRSAEDEAWLPLEEESHGTQRILRMAPTVLRTLGTGAVLVVDELESSLHPVLALHIVRQFSDPQTNPHGAQLIFTTHDTHLLGRSFGEPALRRDQVWLTEKDVDGATCLYPLTDYRPRKEENVERGYLQGRYGAIPFLGDLALTEE